MAISYYCSYCTSCIISDKKQTELSNKQQPFDRRLEKYLFLEELMTLCSKNRNLLKDKNKICDSVELPFAFLTNTSTLERISLAMRKPLSNEEQNIFLTICEMLNKTSKQIDLIWKFQNAHIAGQFVSQYQELRKTMYMQQIIISNLNKQNEREPVTDTEFHKQTVMAAEEYGLISIIENIEETYNEIIRLNIMKQLEKSIRL